MKLEGSSDIDLVLNNNHLFDCWFCFVLFCLTYLFTNLMKNEDFNLKYLKSET